MKTKDIKCERQLMLAELRKEMPKKLNKLGEWYFSKERENDIYITIHDMKAVMK